MAVLPTPGSPISTGLFLVRRASTWMVRRISSSRPITGSSFPSRASAVMSRAYFFNASKFDSAFGLSTVRPLRMSLTAFSNACGSRAGVAQRTGGGRVGGSDRHQQPVLRDVLVAGLGRGLLRGIQDAHEVRRDLRLAGAGALHLWQPRQFGPDRGERRLRVAACGLDQAGGRAFLVVQQRLQQVLRRDLLVELADRDGLGGLQEATRPLGEFLNVHLYVPVT